MFKKWTDRLTRKEAWESISKTTQEAPQLEMLRNATGTKEKCFTQGESMFGSIAQTAGSQFSKDGFIEEHFKRRRYWWHVQKT